MQVKFLLGRAGPKGSHESTLAKQGSSAYPGLDTLGSNEEDCPVPLRHRWVGGKGQRDRGEPLVGGK